VSLAAGAGALMERHGDAKLTDLFSTLADCPKTRSASVHDRARQFTGNGCRKPQPGAQKQKNGKREQCSTSVLG
jgi:hypothetical protein